MASTAPTEIVDHVVPLPYGPRLDKANLRALCRSCHGLKTERDKTLGYEPNRPEDGPRGNSAERGYSSDWQRLREEYAKEHPLCEECLLRETWHPKVLEWWDALWRSPQAGEYTLSDIHGGLYILANHYQDFWKADGAEGRQKASMALFKCWEKFGLSPIDRRRLQWEVEKAEQAEERTQTRRQRKQVSGKDPRDILKIS